ncbi:hypothetical protein TrLO_g213 [Triparma laevis f. longispina]|uniref:Uncharacterized protein n=1 Tax=Triparma laevis f. longispina TaxID=1714387 RepID=A0A9W6ZFU8_9STRA|nr:hypothetical protein TrLO_g213 [Triparma laevis f. longispina]
MSGRRFGKPFLLAQKSDDVEDALARELKTRLLSLEFVEDQWRIERYRLEFRRMKSILTSSPRHVPYEAAKAWVQAQNMWKTQEEWWDWIASGEKHTFYIPSDPETHYRRVGGWEGWDVFLGDNI